MEPEIPNVEDAFAVLASSLRLQILQALADETDGISRSFTDLYEAVDTSNTSQFSYHLNELTDRYVQQTEEGYVISDAGRRIIQSMNAGEYTLQPDFEPVTVSTHCPYCGETSAEATYDGQLATVDCLSCEFTLLRYDLRPAHVENRSPLQALKAADRQMRAEYGTALTGVCPRCGGSIDLDVLTGSKVDPATALIVCDCRHCGTTLSAPVEIALLHHPEVVSRYWDEDVNTVTTPIWEMLSHLAKWSVELDESEPLTVVAAENERIRIDVSCEAWAQANLIDSVRLHNCRRTH
ncbi:ArsR/SmtB family transcription factor [Halorussus salinisoli]|uniref:ArsR/SmtB family transcription factor n=1 Tax=Halorussus salinisoli TaxID=2558242 RepID=UPI0010C1D07D|nr:winged helix-turn-helix domain-containing protein [Halorussus salinisoli]